MDLLIVVAYLIAVIATRAGFSPALAFVLCAGFTLTPYYDYVPAAACHAIYTIIYLALALAATKRTALAMIACATLNWLAGLYYLTPFAFSFDVITFSVSSLAVNLYIIFTMFRGLKDGEDNAVDNTCAHRVFDLRDYQTHTAADTRR